MNIEQMILQNMGEQQANTLSEKEMVALLDDQFALYMKEAYFETSDRLILKPGILSPYRHIKHGMPVRAVRFLSQDEKRGYPNEDLLIAFVPDKHLMVVAVDSRYFQFDNRVWRS